MWPTSIPADFCELCKCLKERWDSQEVLRRAGCWGLRNGRNAHMFSVCDTVADGNRLITPWDRFTLPLHQSLRCFPYLWLCGELGFSLPGSSVTYRWLSVLNPWEMWVVSMTQAQFPCLAVTRCFIFSFSVPICTKGSVTRGKQA